ncbi:hypothetical protein NA56DRAFT_649049 [Hyaloscypha hepaticicola]|uniref:MARVEL domain-containing protein n=1 Tax=Hyaloscypha hepaticicola TaxID=2082293 RepID=A0A2J6PRS6_9HELO|nr:hypothetical protein NA56DRAFT_649049 [Hyaloscypha hepaticicola]
MGFFDEKNGGTAYSASPISPYEPMSATSRNSEDLAEFEKKDLAYKKRIRILRFVTRVLSLIFNAGMIGIMSYAIAKYFLTKNKVIAGNVHPWITPTTLWPSFVLLGISVVTFFLSLITVCTYICGVDAANKTNSVTNYIRYGMMVVRVVAWAVAIGAFKMGSGERSLWGYSCSAPDQIQAQVQNFLDFGKLCTMQNGAYGLSILQAITYFLTFIVTIMMVRRASTKKRMSKAKQSMAMESGYNQGGYGQESGTVYDGNGKRYMPVVESPHV